MLILRALRALLLLFIVVLAPAAALAQEVAPGYVHQQWTARDGLPVDGLNDVLQTRDGYLWIATWDGLVRFDGVRFVTFNVGNTDALPSNRITHLFELPDGRLRIITTQPVSVVENRAGRFTRLADGDSIGGQIRAVLMDPDGTLWLGGSGLFRVGPDSGGPQRVRSWSAHTLVRDASGALWVGQLSGEGLLEIRNGDVRRWRIGDVRGSNFVAALWPDTDGTLWIGTHAGLYRLRGGRITAIPPVSGAPPSVERIVRDDAGTLWVERSGSMTLYRVEGERMFATELPSLRVGPGAGLEPRVVTSGAWNTAGPLLLHGGTAVFHAPSPIVAHVEDREGNLWLATFNSGLHRVRPAEVLTLDLPSDAVGRRAHSVLEDATGAVWIGTPSGNVFRWSQGEVAHVPGYLGDDWLTRDNDGLLWSGHAVLPTAAPGPDPQLMAAIRSRPEAGSNLIHPQRFTAMVQDPSGARWFRVGGSRLIRYFEGSWTPYSPEDGFPPHHITSIRASRDGAVWFLTLGGGVVRFADGRFQRLTAADGLASDYLRGFHEDAEGILWIGSVGKGLTRIDARAARSLSDARISVIRSTHGLADDVVHQILEDDHGRLWMGSNRGIFSMRRADLNDLVEGRIERVHSVQYNQAHGMKTQEVNGGGFPSGLRTRDGRLWFPTQDGVAVIDPNALPAAPGLSVFVETLSAGGTLLPLSGDLRLRPNQRDLEIRYTAPSFIRAEHLRFRYRLDGYHTDWVEADTRRAAFFTNLPPGRYTFRVAVTRGDGVWAEAGSPLPLVLEPRFRETGWFRALLLAGLLLGAVMVGRWRGRRLRAQARTLERLVSERTADLAREKEITAQQAESLAELDRAKGRFFANISHEFRTPLTLILGPLRDLSEGRHGPLPQPVRAQHEMMLRNGKRLLRLINQVLDLARLESGALTADAEPRDMVELARAATRSFLPLAERQGIALAFHSHAGRLMAQVDAEQMEKVLLNLISNAFKFTEPGGRVEVTVAAEGADAVIEVRDSGVGIAPEELPRVFDRFYQADGSATRRHEGSGIGLSLAKELVELHGGSIAVESQPGEGSTFTVRLPLLAAQEAAPRRVQVLALAGGEPGANGQGLAREERPAEEEADRTTVLVVDDNADVRAYVRSVLEPAFRVIEAADGEEGLERTREALPDLVLADVMMPRLDGIGLARALRADRETDCIPVVLLTARAGTDAEVEGLETGADDYITKPFDSSVLEARVANLIASRRRLRERFRQEGVPAAPAAPELAPARTELEERLRAAVEANLTDPGFNQEALAAAAGLSYKQLYRRLREELDATPSQFIRTVRVERAAELLQGGAGSVAEVAYSVGFNSLSYFNRSYRERFGAAPSESLETSS